jgi:hypothetical protein
MRDKKADTSISSLIKAFEQIGGDPSVIKKLINAPDVKSRKHKMTKPDPNLNKTFTLKRIDFSVTAEITNSRLDGLYNAEILSIVEGDTLYNVGDVLPISKRELELTGRIIKQK